MGPSLGTHVLGFQHSTIIHPDLFELAMIFYKRNENYYKMEKNQRLLELGLVVVSSKAARF